MFGLGSQELLVVLVVVGLIGTILAAVAFFKSQRSRASSRGAQQSLPGPIETERTLDAVATQRATERAKAEKPAGLVLIAVYSAISAALCVIAGARLLEVGAIEQWAAILGLVLLLLGVALFAATYGLWCLVPWGNSLARALYLATIPVGLVMILLNRTSANVVFQLVGIALAAWIISYLSTPQTMALFERRSGAPDTQ